MKQLEWLSFYYISVPVMQLLGTKLSLDPAASEKAEKATVVDDDVLWSSLAFRLLSSPPRHGTLQPSSDLFPSPANTLREMSLPSIAFGALAASFQRDVRLPHGGVAEERDCFREWRGRGGCERLWVAGRYIGLWAWLDREIE